jgi:predicted RecB family nuclease
MRVEQETATLSATDFANHLSCRHLTTLDLRLAKGEIAELSWENPHLRVLQQRGLEHEEAYIESLRSKGLAVVDLSNEAEEMADKATWAAMKSGAQAIVQASLGNGDWRGRADVLLRVERLEKPGRLGNWSYEVVDCKLARETKAETILQLCLYSELVTELQGLEPELFHVIRPNLGFQSESYRLSAFAAYYRVVKNALQEAVKAGSGETYPEPVSHCEICRWWKECDGRRRRDDHLSFIAGASRVQRKELTLQGVPDLESLAKIPLPISFNPSRGDRLLRGEVFIDLHSITKQSVRASVEQYSLKEMERFCDYRRRVPLPEASQSRHFIEHQLELSLSPTLIGEAYGVVEGYNERSNGGSSLG